MPAQFYDIVQDFDRSRDPDEIDMTPFWILAVVPLVNPDTFDRRTLTSISTTAEDAVSLRRPPILITSDCVRLNITRAKESHIKQLSATLMPSQNYLSLILPGDWVGCWIVNSEAKFKDLLVRLRRGDACNRWDDGLKFIGRLSAPRKTTIVEPGIGIKTVRYNVSAMGFKELDSTVFYDEALRRIDPSLATWMARMEEDLTKLILGPGENPQTRGVISGQKAIPVLFDLLIGKGIPKSYANPDDKTELQIVTGLTNGGTEAPYAYIIPKVIADWLGKKSRQPSKASGIPAYADIVELLIGVQRYRFNDVGLATLAAGAGSAGTNQSPIVFTPDGIAGQTGGHKTTGTNLLGSYVAWTPNFTNKTVWSVLNEFLNPAVNEMYSCLRVNNEGSIVPTIIARQLPFSSNAMMQHLEGRKNPKPSSKDFIGPSDDADDPRFPNTNIPEITPFLELPRWRLHPILVTYEDLGRSDALRFNFLDIRGESPISKSNTQITKQRVLNPPPRDNLDIWRNGLRMTSSVVNCSPEDALLGPKTWMLILADILMGQHLTIQGTLTCFGIQAPICEGDNLEFDNIVFHIETLIDECSISPDGRKIWRTNMMLTHGVASDNDPQYRESLIGPVYAGLTKTSQTTYDPGLSIEDNTEQQQTIKEIVDVLTTVTRFA